MVWWAREHDMRIVLGVLEQKTKIDYEEEGNEPDVRTRNLLIWGQTLYHGATDPFTNKIKKLEL